MNPGLAGEIRREGRLEKATLRKFHDGLYGDYRKVLPGAKTILFKMKELWGFLAPVFENYEKYTKKIRKAEKLYLYEKAVDLLFEEQELAETSARQQSVPKPDIIA